MFRSSSSHRAPVEAQTVRRHARRAVAAVALVASVGAFGVAPVQAKNRPGTITADQPGFGGQWLFNSSGAYYMGRVWVGDSIQMNTFTENGKLVWSHIGAANSSTYRYAKVARGGGLCFWVGSAASKTSTNWVSFGNPVGEGNVCSESTIAALKVESNFGAQYNCKPGTGGNGPARTIAVSAANVYANLAWTRDGSGRYVATNSAGRDQIGQVGPKQRVDYRYTTLDGNWHVVYVPALGQWGFVKAGTVNRYGTTSPNSYNWAAPNTSKPPAVRGYFNNAGENSSNGCTTGF